MSHSKQRQAISEMDRIFKRMMETEVGRREFLAAVPFLLASCATTEQSRHREGDNTGQETELTVDDERRMTKEALQEMRKDYPAVQDPELQNYISAVGSRLTKANNLEGHPYNYSFTVVDVGYVNAFALPAGTIFVTTPLLAMAESEAELAGVVGHEIGHVKARHTAERIEAQKKQTSSWVYALGGGILGGVAGYGLGKLICPPNDNDCTAKAAQYGAIAGVGGGLLVQKYKFMANSREDEMEADRIGFRTAVQAGYAPSKVGEFYSKLQKMESERKQGGAPLLASLADVMSTHPPSGERVQQMNEMAHSAPANPRAVTSTQTFDRIRKRAGELARAKASKG